MNTLSVVIPALNEEDGIADIIERVLAIKGSLAKAGVSDLELIVVDDGSLDRKAEIVGSYPEVVLVQHAVNRGYGAAIKTGFRHAKGNLLAFLDADGTYPPKYFPQLCRPILEQGADLVIGRPNRVAVAHVVSSEPPRPARAEGQRTTACQV